MVILALILAPGLGFGLAFWICASLLNKSNNIGDSHATAAQYNTQVSFKTRIDRISKEECKTFPNMHAENIDDPNELEALDKKVSRS